MDPYLERREIWPDFHDSLITYIREVLQPLLRPRCVALIQDLLALELMRDEIRQPLIHGPGTRDRIRNSSAMRPSRQILGSRQSSS